MWPWIGVAIAAAVGKEIYDALSGDDNSSSSDDSSYRREEALRQERESHNQKIEQEIATYVDGEVSKIEDSIKVMEKRHNTRPKWRWIDARGLSFARTRIGAQIATQAATKQTTNNDLLHFSGLDTSALKKKNQHLKEEIKKLEEFKNAIQ